MSNFALQLARRFEPRNVAIGLVAVIASFAFLDLVYRHALDSLIAFHLDDSDPAARNSFPAVVMGAMLLGAGALALAVARMRDTAQRGWWRATAAVFIFFAVEESLGIHTWLDRHLDVSWNVVYLPFVTIAAIVWFETIRLMARNRDAQLAFGAGIGGWLLAAVLDAARTGRAEALMVGELVEITAAALFLLGMFSFARSRSLAERPASEDAGESTLAIAVAAVGNVDVRALVGGLACFAVLFAILGSIVYPGGGDLRAFDLNKEQTFPATFSGALLLAAGGLALLNGFVRSPSASDRRWWIVLALVFAFLGLDEIAALHEAVQDRVHVWGQAVLAPVVVVGVYAWWRAMRQLWNEQPAGLLFLAGAGAWIFSQLIDAGLNEHWGWTIVPEEVLEMTGSALFGLALLVALQRLVAPAVAAMAPARRSASDSRMQQVPAATR
jgi:predicted tellurium resistance membrane protein TerC